MFIATLLLFAAPQQAPAPPPDSADAAHPQVADDGTSSWSVLADPCADARREENGIVVCGRRTADTSQRLPLPGERGPPDRPLPSNPDKTGIGALTAAGSPCATRSEGCTVGVDVFGGATFLVRALGKLVDPDSCCEDPGEATNPVALINDVGRLFKGGKDKASKGERVPIRLDDGDVPPGGSPADDPQ